MKILNINKNIKDPELVIVVTDKLAGQTDKILKYYLSKLGDLKKKTQIIAVDVPDKGVLKKADFKVAWDDITNYCETKGIEHIAVTYSHILKNLTGSSKAFKFEAAQGTAEVFGGLTVYPLLNFAVLLFAPDKVKLLNRSLTKIKATVEDGVIQDTTPVLDHNLKYYKPKQVQKVLNNLLKYKELVCDIETTGLQFTTDKLLTISFSWNKKSSVCIGMHEQYSSLEESLEIHRMLKEFFILYNKDNGVLIGHNFAVFDLPFVVHQIMRDWDFEEPVYPIIKQFNIYDTLQAMWIIENSTTRTPINLKELTYSIMGDYDRHIDQKSLITYTFDEVAEYNNLDCIANWWVYERCIKEIVEQEDIGLLKEYVSILRTIATMKMTGLRVDRDRVNKANEELKTIMSELMNNLMGSTEVRTTIMRLNDLEAKKYNDTHLKQKTSADFDTEFKVGSNNHKKILFKDVLGVPVLAKTKTKQPSYDSDVISTIVNNPKEYGEEASQIAGYIQQYAKAKTVQGTFLKAFLEKSIDIGGGDYRLFASQNPTGTISSRLTVNSPNFQNMPSKGVYGKLVKSCFINPEGQVFAASDYSALETISLANVSKDELTLSIIEGGFDTHCVNTLLYFKDDLESRGIDINPTSVESVNSIAELAGDLRTESKPVTFGLAYLCSIFSIMSELNCDEERAQQILDNYWGGYVGVKAYYDGQVTFAKQNGYVRSAFNGLRLWTPNVNSSDARLQESEIRTICNFSIQSSSYTLLKNMSKFMEWVDDNDLHHKVQIANTIYDAVYKYIDDDIDLIAEVNNAYIKIMVENNLPDQLVPNKMQMEIGYSWDKLEELPITITSTDVVEAKKVLEDKAKELAETKD